MPPTDSGQAETLLRGPPSSLSTLGTRGVSEFFRIEEGNVWFGSPV